MKDITLKSLASELNITIENIIKYFLELGLSKNIKDFITLYEKELLLEYLYKNNIETQNSIDKLVVYRKRYMTLNVSTNISGKIKSIPVSIRKKYIFHESIKKLSDNMDLSSEVKQINDDISLLPVNNSIQQTLIQKKEEKLNIIKEDKLKGNKINILENNLTESKSNDDVIKNKDFNSDNNLCLIKSIKEINDLNIEDNIEKKLNKKLVKKDNNQNYSEQDVKKNKTSYLDSKVSVINENDITITYNKDDSMNSTSKCDKKENFIKVGNVSLKNKNIRNNSLDVDKRKRSNSITKEKTFKFNKNIRILDIDLEKEDVKNSNLSNIYRKKLNVDSKKKFFKDIHTISRTIIIKENISVIELSNKMSIKSTSLIKILSNMGFIININDLINKETAKLIIEKMGHRVIIKNEYNVEQDLLFKRKEYYESLSVLKSKVRDPVVVILGHVDHGKTSLLDCIRKSSIVNSEFGGITQRIGAYSVHTDKGNITFLDTPGHEAFFLMRQRGVHVTDIVVLVVAADDGVMPQTVEAINHAKSVNVPIIVVINKIDKIEIDIKRTMNELMKYDILPEEWGGDQQFIRVSAKTGEGIFNLLDAILLQAEMLELKVVFEGLATGVVIEAYLDKYRGSIATILVQQGTLKTGDVILCGLQYGRIKAMRNDKGQSIDFAIPSSPVEVLGLSGVPLAGDNMIVVTDEKKAKEIVFYRQKRDRDIKLSQKMNQQIHSVFNNINCTEIKELNIIIKSDFRGSLEAIKNSLENLSKEEKVKIKIISYGIGNVTETDIALASTTHSVLICFNVDADSNLRKIIELEKLDVRFYNIIYNLIDDISQIIHEMLDPEYEYKVIGLVEVRNVFRSLKFGSIAGCMVTEGIIKRNNKIRVLRNNKVLHIGEIGSLRRFKDDVSEIRKGVECGISLKNYSNIICGDIFESIDYIIIDK